MATGVRFFGGRRRPKRAGEEPASRHRVSWRFVTANFQPEMLVKPKAAIGRSRRSKPASDPKWDRKQGVPKDRQTASLVERSTGRYSASDQSEKQPTKR